MLLTEVQPYVNTKVCVMGSMIHPAHTVPASSWLTMYPRVLEHVCVTQAVMDMSGPNGGSGSG